MAPFYPFDSRNPLYKSVLTAVAAGDPLRLRLLIHRDANVYDAYLRIRNDDEDKIYEYKMQPAEWLEDYRFYEIELKNDTGLYWYSFYYTSVHGIFHIVKTDHSLGVVSNREGDWWQLTVYSADFKTPDKFAGGLIYQIFPDRFYNNGPTSRDIPEDRYICTDWQATPAFESIDSKRRICNDYYGGTLSGITEKLDYLESLSVTCIYLNPIFEAHSNHRYNTADYFHVDPSLGTDDDFKELCRKANEKGISVILDGVFSHTGDDSIYFNRKGRYDSEGAYQSQSSPYSSWFKFSCWPDSYDSWWGVDTLPETNENDPGFSEFITGESGVLRHWMRMGASGWRLDVADELPDEFLEKIRSAIKAENPHALLIGEVWEDATNKISYGHRRKFLSGRQLDSVMNYPLADLIIGFIRGGNSRDLIDGILTLRENYPPQCVDLAMNHIGTHDTPRILTRLGTDPCPEDRRAQSTARLSKLSGMIAKKRLILASVLQYTLPGIPSLYYADEAGTEGWSDPFCRRTYPWGQEDNALIEHYKFLGRLRKEHPVFASGEFIPLYSDLGYVTYLRRNTSEEILICVNRWCDDALIQIPEGYNSTNVLFGETPAENTLCVKSENFAILCKKL